MQISNLMAALQRAVAGPAMGGIYIKSVFLAATYIPDHDVCMTITWSMPDHTATVETTATLPGLSATMISRPSDTTILLPREMVSPAEIEDCIMAVAWMLGAWDVVRNERAPLDCGEAWQEARYGITSSFGRNTYTIAGQPLAIGESAVESAMQEAARDGYVSWRFIPLALATPIARQRWGNKDRTLKPDCTRDGEPNIGRAPWRRPRDSHTAHEHIYQLGRGNHGNRSKAGAERRA